MKRNIPVYALDWFIGAHFPVFSVYKTPTKDLVLETEFGLIDTGKRGKFTCRMTTTLLLPRWQVLHMPMAIGF
ncbi:hypothetical protein [Bartonella machadoae]|uniref:hypothetical protein n=1 Tax=Bartonella machadoae TaxID=2893471 RepID=UPI001F4D2077|nr:hypothetical protein [Bartonella machadoae]UNE53959.1 hypothetical protein LNM86_10315 [Bartonella machadoae]